MKGIFGELIHEIDAVRKTPVDLRGFSISYKITKIWQKDCLLYAQHMIHQCLNILFRGSNRSNAIIFYQKVQNVR